jgi:hypothetical protein
MARDFYINGETMVFVKAKADSPFGGNMTQLGLAEDPIKVTPKFIHKDINVDAWGEAPAEVQFMLAELSISMNLIHFDRSIIDACMQLSMGGAPAIGQLTRAGARLGNNAARFAAGGPGVGNFYIGLNLTSPIGAKPWRFYYTYLTGQPAEFPLGVDRSVIRMNWRCIPYTQDPWGSPTATTTTGAQGYQLWDYTLDSP